MEISRASDWVRVLVACIGLLACGPIHVGLGADKSGVSPNSISLPKGPGSIEGLGDAFQPSLATGTAKYGLKVLMPAGPAGFSPTLSLSYDGGGPNGPLGYGWALSLPFIQRQTEKGSPRYVDGPNGFDDDNDGELDEADEVDILVTEDKEELVPVDGGYWFTKNQSQFVRYRREGEGWTAQMPDGTRMVFGSSLDSQVRDSGTGRVFAWLLVSMTDTHGNTALFSYRRFDRMEDASHVYLETLRYGPGAGPWAAYHQVRLRYEPRQDWFEDNRPGFPLRTGHRISAIEVSTHGVARPGFSAMVDAGNGGIPGTLVRRYELGYRSPTDPGGGSSYLSSVRIVGSDAVSALPPASFTYSVCEPMPTISAQDQWIDFIGTPGVVMDSGSVEFVDLNGDGLPDILRTDGGIHRAWLNHGVEPGAGRSVIRWSQEVRVKSDDPGAFAFSLATTEPAAHLADMDGDGLADLVVKPGGDDLFYFRSLGNLGWDRRQRMTSLGTPAPSPYGEDSEGDLGSPVASGDVNFNKAMDVLRTESTGYRIWYNLGSRRFSRPVTVTDGDVIDLSLPGAALVDFNGDRVPDLVRTRRDHVLVRTGLGNGRFSPARRVRIPDLGLDDSQIAQARFHDLTGDGLVELVLERPAPGQVWFWPNRGNFTLGGRTVVGGMPAGSSTAVVRWADVNGNGTTDYVVADSRLPSRLRAVDFAQVMGCSEGPNLLKTISNGIGRVTEIEYRSSTEFSAEDERAGRPWADRVPNPMQLVSAIIVRDSMGHAYRSEIRYRDGYYDPIEKQFRGFREVIQRDVGDATAPTLVSRSLFDTGKEHEVMKGRLLRLAAEQEDGSVFYEEATGWTVPPIILGTGTDGRLVSYAHPTNRIRNVVELGRGIPRRLEVEMDYDRFGNEVANRNYGIVEQGNRSVFDDERFTRTVYAINTNAWILRTVARAELSDEHNNVLSRAEFYYDDPTFSGSNFGQVNRGDQTLKLEWIDAGPTNRLVRSSRTRYDVHGNPVLLLDPLARLEAGVPDLSRGHARELTYETNLFTFAVRETIHLGEGKAPLVFQAAYDEGFGTVVQSTDFNGNTTRFRYDEFGRLIGIVRPGDTADFPTVEYSYALAVPFRGSNIVNYVETRLLDRTNRVADARRDSYFISREFIDGLGRKLLSKQEATEDGGAVRVSVKGAVRFNARKKPAEAINPFYTLLPGSLDDQLAFESIEEPGWTGQFALGNSLVRLELASAHRSSTTYDATLREVTATNPDGTFRRVAHEPLLTKSYDENDSDPASPYFDTPMVHHNDGLGRLVRVDEISRLGDDGLPVGDLRTWTTCYEYDLNDQLTHILDSQENEKWFRYDGLKRKVFMDDPNRGVMHFAYDEASNLIQTIDAKEQRISYTYDGANRIRTEDYHDEGRPFSANHSFNPAFPLSASNRADVVFFYDVPQPGLDVGDGSLATAENVRGKLAYVWDLSGEEHTSHDARDRVGWVVKRVRDPIHQQLVTYRTAFEYDSLDRITTLTYPDNDAVAYRYHDRNLLSGILGGPSGSIISNVVYLPSEQMAEIGYGNGVRTRYGYDPRIRLASLLTIPPGKPDQPYIAFEYDFDPVSNIRAIHDQRPASVVAAGDPRRNTQHFQYDDLYRLTRAQYSFALPGSPPANDGEIRYQYDRIGNMLGQVSSITDVDPHNGLSVANLGIMESGGSAGRSGRKGRRAQDPPGPHALTSMRSPAGDVRQYPYDSNGNMTDIDGMVATWDFKDRLVALEDATMRAEYTYDFTDRRITKRVGKKASPAPPLVARVGYAYSTIYVGKHFEVREFDAPTKYVFNGETRVARVTGTLSPNQRVQRLRLHAGWNLVSVAVTAAHGGAQLGATGKTEGIHRWNPLGRSFVAVTPEETLEAGTVIWVKTSSDTTLRVMGYYPGPRPVLRAPPRGDFLPSYGLEVLPLTNQPASLTTWWYAPGLQGWETTFPRSQVRASAFPPVLAPHEALYVAASSSVDLELPDAAGSVRFYHQDHLGSSSVVSDGDGILIEEVASLPFGSPRRQFRLRGGRGDYQFTQKERDLESSLIYFKGRFMSPNLGRFLSSDPLLERMPFRLLSDPRSLNVYSYAKDSPISNIDPDGFECVSVLNGGSEYCSRAVEYARIHNEVSQKTSFFGAASAVSEALAHNDSHVFNRLIASSETREFFGKVGRDLRELNLNAVERIKSGDLRGPNLDSQLVRMEQSRVQEHLNSLQSSDPAAYGRVVKDANSGLNPSSGLRGLGGLGGILLTKDAAYLKVLDGVRHGFGRDIDFAKQGDREAIGDALCKWVERTGGNESVPTLMDRIHGVIFSP